MFLHPFPAAECTCIAYADIDTVYLVFPEAHPVLLFHSRCRKCNLERARSSSSGRHRSSNMRSTIKHEKRAAPRLFARRDAPSSRKSVHTTSASRSSSLTYPDRYNFRLFSLPWLLPLLCLLSSPFATLVNEIHDIAWNTLKLVAPSRLSASSIISSICGFTIEDERKRRWEMMVHGRV